MKSGLGERQKRCQTEKVKVGALLDIEQRGHGQG